MKMKLDEALDKLKQAGMITEENTLTGNVESHFELGDDESNVAEWFDENVAGYYKGQVDMAENSAGNTVVKMKGATVGPRLAKDIFDYWYDSIASFSINAWRH